MKLLKTFPLSFLIVTAAIGTCFAANEALEKKLDTAPVIVDAVELIAVLTPTTGNTAAGTVVFKPLPDDKVEVTARITGLAPGSKHAIHIHQYGDLTSSDGSSAGDHYNPMGHQHGLPDTKKRHAGDFGNIEADSSGVAELHLVVDNISLVGRKNPIIGRGVIVHAKPDDGGQPTGNAGERVAAGVIGVRNPKHSKE